LFGEFLQFGSAAFQCGTSRACRVGRAVFDFDAGGFVSPLLGQDEEIGWVHGIKEDPSDMQRHGLNTQLEPRRRIDASERVPKGIVLGP